MKKNLLAICLILSFVMVFVACDDNNNPDNPLSYPSYRDRIYTGDNLAVYLDGQKVETAVSADVKSNQLPTPDDVAEGEDYPKYKTTVVLTGFPESGKVTTFETVSTLSGFSGDTAVGNITYSYIGEFTGTPLDEAEKQGCIIRFTTK